MIVVDREIVNIELRPIVEEKSLRWGRMIAVILFVVVFLA